MLVDDVVEVVVTDVVVVDEDVKVEVNDVIVETEIAPALISREVKPLSWYVPFTSTA